MGLKQDLAYVAGKDVDLTMALVMLVVLQDITLQSGRSDFFVSIMTGK